MTELTLDTELSDQQREYLQSVQTSGRALLDVINEVLDFSKVDAGRVELEEVEFTLWETATGALKPLAVSAHTKGVEVLYDEGPDVPERVRGDPGRLRQSLINLVGNAVKFTDEGTVQLTVRHVSSSDDVVRVRFEVRDTGIGIPADKLEHVFGSFNQVDSSVSRRFGGTGLGLSITSRIVQMMGGEIEVESELGTGSTFSFEANFKPATEAAPTTSEPSLEGLRGLVVDDFPANRHIVAKFAKSMGIETVEAATAAEALTILDAAHREGQPIDLALFECHMPGVGGFEMAEQIRKDSRFENLVMLAFTAAGSPGDGARCAELGIASYLLRPVAPTELRAALHLTLGAPSDAVDTGELVTRHSLREARTSLNVLVAEDNQVNQKLATHLLERFGHRVTVVENGEQALTAIEGGDFDIVFMDIQMPIMDGVEATQRIRAREAEDGSFTTIVAMTAHAMAGDRERFLGDRLREILSDIERGVGEQRGAVEASEGEVEASEREVEASEGAVGATQRAVSEGTGRPARESPEATPPQSFNREVFLEHTESDPDLIRTLVEVFEIERVKHLTDLEAALTGQDAEALAHAAHTMKGALGVFGAESARKGAETLEFLGRSGEIAECGEQVEELKEAVLALEEDLRRFVETL
jgi:CheY-like chemotaxis protein